MKRRVTSHQDVVIRRATESDLAAIVAMLADDELGAQRESPDDLTPYQRSFEVLDVDPHHCSSSPSAAVWWSELCSSRA